MPLTMGPEQPKSGAPVDSIIRHSVADLHRLAGAWAVDVHVDVRSPVALAVDEVGLIVRPTRNRRRQRRLLATGILACLALRLGSKG